LELPTMRGLTEFFLGAIIILVMALRRDGLVGDDELDETLVGKFRRLRKRRVDRRLGTSNASDPVR
jgi:branched-chain amino acid transport system permease protein